MPTPVILDVDTGVDDACALLLAALHPDLDLRAVTCVSGNASLPDVTRNTLTVLETCGRADVRVAAGASHPLLEAPVHARHVHGSDGMADLGWPTPTATLDPRHAVDLLRETVDEADASGAPVTLVPLGPMTNIALFARMYPESFAKVARIVFMGGGAMVSNVTASAEFNVFHDPEAAAAVLDACADQSVPVAMYGLDVFYAPRVSLADVDALVDAESGEFGATGRGPRDLAAGLIRFMSHRFDDDSATIGDAGAVAMLVAPDAVRTERLPVRIELAGTWTRGRTIVDTRDWSGDMEHDPHGLAHAQVDVAVEIDASRVARLWLDTLTQEGR